MYTYETRNMLGDAECDVSTQLYLAQMLNGRGIVTYWTNGLVFGFVYARMPQA